MKVFESIRSWFNPPPMHEAPQYGRGIHALPNPKEQELFDEASEGFIHGDTLLGYERFLSSL
ncbi:MAG: hypothetical protein PHX59_02400, partial [Sulfuricurvum sp.]|nr:hypothetical protein [Sulfuricurvum sp.]